MRRVLAILAASTGLATAGADPAPRLEPGNWRVRASSVTNGAADPPADSEVCLRDELEDLVAYFMPALEGVPAKCTSTRVPSKDPRVIAGRLRCTGKGFTYNATSSVTIVSPTRFTLTMSSEARTATETGIVSAKGEGDRLGACAP